MQVYYLELFLPVSDSVLAETLLASLPKGLTLYPKEWNYSSSVFHPKDRWGDTVSAIQPVGTRNHFIRKLNYDVAGPYFSKIRQEAHSRLGCIGHEPPVELRWEGRLLLCLYTTWAFCCQPGCCASAPNTSLLPNLGNTHGDDENLWTHAEEQLVLGINTSDLYSITDMAPIRQQHRQTSRHPFPGGWHICPLLLAGGEGRQTL